VRCLGALVVLASALILSLSTPAFAQQAATPAAGDDEVTLNFVNADLQAVIKAVAEITGRNILIDPRVTGTVNIVAPKPVPRSMVFSILLSALRAQGFSAVGGDLGFIRVVPEAEAKFYPGAGDPRRARGDQIVTEVFTLQYESAQQLVPVLRPLVSPNNIINAFPATNTLIVTDYAENLRRIRRVIASIDQPHPGELLSLKLQHANAVDVAQTVQRLIPEAAAATQPGVQQKVAVTVDSRTNSLLVRADNPTLASRIRSLAASIDLPTTAAGNIHVVYLKNADATKMAETLRAIVSGQATQAQQRQTTPGLTPTPGLTGAQPGLTPPGMTQPGQSPATTPLGSGFGATPTGTQAGAQQGSMIQAYPETNSLVIIAPDNIYNALRSVIEKLDSRRAQVFVEALVVEVTANRAAEFGIQWQDLSGLNRSGTQVIGGTNFGGAGTNIIGAAQNLGTIGTGLNLGVVRGRVTIPGIGEVLNLGFLARALEKDSNANILATPTLLTLDNEEARIIVGQNIPIVTGSFTAGAATGGVVNPFQTFDRRDIGLTLRVKPQVTQGGSVRLQIFQEVSSIFDRTNPSGIITNKRALESQVIVDDGQTIVLGGLISDDTQSSEERVPLLGSIPFVGQLFRYERRQRDKTNLMVFLRPMIIRDVDQAASITGDRYDYIRGVQSTTQPRSSWILPDMPPKPMPELPRPPQSAARPPEGAPPVIDLRERPDAGGSTVTPR
jgi:general secretion pathway protein D